MEKDNPIIFAFAVHTVQRADGNPILSVYSENKGLPDEFVITLMRNWLKAYESAYHENFKKEHSS